MFEPPGVVRKSRRGETKETAKRTEAQLLEHIARLTTMAEVDILKAQMEAEMIPKTKAVKKALDKQEEEIEREQQDEVASPSEVAAQARRLKRELRKLGAKATNTGVFFGPLSRKRKSRARTGMKALENAELDAAIAAENARIEAEGAAPALPPAVASFAPAPAGVSHNAIMNALADRFAQVNLGPRTAVANGKNPFTRRGVPSRGVPGYDFRDDSEGGGRRTRRTRSRR